jgi:hypothetical protein
MERMMFSGCGNPGRRLALAGLRLIGMPHWIVLMVYALAELLSGADD